MANMNRTLFGGPPDDWQPHSGTKAFLFDKDGTLVDQNARCREYMLKVTELGERDFARDVSAALGWSYEESRFIDPRSPLAVQPWSEVELIVADAISRHVGSRTVRQELLRRASAYVVELSGLESTVPLLDVCTLFKAIRATGCRIGVVTSDMRSQTEAELAHLGVADDVGAVVCGDDEGIPSKPDPAPLLSACKQLGVEPADAVYVGDAVTDMEAGTAAGCRYRIAVKSGLDVGSSEEYQAWAFGKA